MTQDYSQLLQWAGYSWTVMVLAILTALGLTLSWIGALIAMLTALGRRQWGWAAALVLTGPLAAVPYGLRHRAEASYPLWLALGGILLMLPFALFVLYSVLHR